MSPTLTYRQGYFDGFRGLDPDFIARAHDQAEFQNRAKLSGADEANYWNGYNYGRFHRQHGEPAIGATVPDLCRNAT